MDLNYLVCLVFLIGGINCIEVATPFGTLIGKVNQNESISFLAVPYAKPPVGPKRFRPPSYPLRWNGTRDATKSGPACIQPESSFGHTYNVSEDCLTLDIYVDGTSINNTAKMPVLVYIHGGGFVAGSSTENDFSKVVAGNGIIAVAIQYRLGLLGFAQSPDDKKIPGNIGLKDQITALKWVKKNINNFGGDGEQITVSGESAGSASVAYHLISPMAKDLIKRAILESGGPGAAPTWDQVQEKMRRVIELTDCINQHPNERFSCLRNVPIDKLLQVQIQLSSQQISFWPTVDSKYFVNMNPGDSVKLGQFSVDLESMIMGQNGNELGMSLASSVPDLFPLTGYPKSKVYTPTELKAEEPFFKNMNQSSWEKFVDLTFGNRSSMNETDLANTMGHIMSDKNFNCPYQPFLASYRKNCPKTKMYFYNFLARPSKPETRKLVPYIRDALHAEELQFFYGKPLLNENAYTPEEINLSRQIIKELTTFVKTGSVADDKWPQIEPGVEQPKYAHIAVDSTHIEYRSGLPTQYCDQ